MQDIGKGNGLRLEVNSEERAWEILAGLLDNEIEIESIDDLILGDWVKATVLIPEERYDSALNTYMMQGWQDAQRAIYRSYALVAKGTADGRVLSDLEKDNLELVVKVKSGSSDQEADLIDVLKEAAKGAVEKMEPEQIAIVLLVLILTWGGQSVLRTWLNNRKEERLAELSQASNKEAFQTISKAFETIQAVATDEGKMSVLEQATDEISVVKDLRDEAQKARASIVKHAAQTDASVNGVSIPADAGQNLTRESRSTATEEQKDGAYRVQKVDTQVPDGFRVFVENVETEEQFSASVQEVISSLSHREVIKEAEWSKVPVQLQINAKIYKGKVTDAVILRADKFETPDSE